ncbi:MAG: type II secretion system protein [Campylobacterota bacterium]|nr:type II secretion system protein [Campylobacterota bacterium]
MKVGMRKGFSLIEIGIVMVVIGLIIAAVMKGKDVIKGAETKEVAQNFMGKWVSAADTYYDKMGFNPYGTRAMPMIGATPNTAILMNIPGETDPDANVTTTWQAAGIDIRNLIKTDTGNPTNAYIAGEYTEDSEVTVDFAYAEINERMRNVVIFNDVPVDVAKAFDKLVDSSVDGSTGKVVTDTTTADTVGNTNAAAVTFVTTAWPDVTENAVTDVYIILEH